jgi:Putative beta-barrel porin 2
MRQSTVRILLGAIAALYAVISAPAAKAQEAVSTTTSSGSSGASSSVGATGSDVGSTLSGATGTTTGVTGSTSSTPTLESGSSGSGVFSPTPVKISATLVGGYDDNVNNQPSATRQSSEFVNGSVDLDYKFGDPRLQLTLDAVAGGTYYFSDISSQNYDINLTGAFTINYKASPRLTLGSSILVAYLTEPSFNYAGGINSRNGNYLYTTDKVFLDYAWSRRFSTRTSYTFEAFNYDNNAVGNISNRVTNLFGNEFRLQLVPTTSLVIEYRFEIVSYQDSSLDSTTHFALGGIDHIFNPRLTASLRGGAEFRSYSNDGDRTSPYFEGNVAYALGRRTSVSWNTRYGLEEPDLPGSQSRTTFRTGLQTKFNLTSRTSTAVDLYYVHDDYHSLTSGLITTPAFSEDTFNIGLTLRYGITALIGVQASYHYTDVSSDAALREYSRNSVSAGVNVTF